MKETLNNIHCDLVSGIEFTHGCLSYSYECLSITIYYLKKGLHYIPSKLMLNTLIDFNQKCLTDLQQNFIGSLEEKNGLYVFRFNCRYPRI